MRVQCEKCLRFYDDLYRWTFCPHDEFKAGMKIDIIAHERPTPPARPGGYSRSVIKMGICRITKRKLPLGNILLGTAQQAIEFGLTIDDHYDMREFLDGWMHGDVEEWEEYQDFLRSKAA